MTVTGESDYISAKSGIKKDGTNWYMLKFLDEASEEFFSAFISDESLFNQMNKLQKHTPVILTLNLIPGSKYFSIDMIEVVNK